LFEVEDGEPSGNESSRFCRRILDQLAMGKGEKVVRLLEPAGIDERCDVDREQHPLVPGVTGRWYGARARGWAHQLEGLLEATDSNQGIGHRPARCGLRPRTRAV